MAEQWLTYSDLGERLGVSAEAARQKAIRARWPRRTANDGKAQVLVDVEDVRATIPPRKLKDDTSEDEGPTPVEPVSDGLTLVAHEAHIETLKSMVAKADELVGIERQRADGDRVRADAERDRADQERLRADELAQRLDRIRDTESEKRAGLERDLIELRSLVEEMQRPRSWWKRLTG